MKGGGEREGLRSMLSLCTLRPAAGWIGVIDQAQSIYSARLLGLCGWRLFLNYYRRQMVVRRCSLSRLDFFRAGLLFSLCVSLHLRKFVFVPFFLSLTFFFRHCTDFSVMLNIPHLLFISWSCLFCSMLFPGQGTHLGLYRWDKRHTAYTSQIMRPWKCHLVNRLH